MQWGKDAHGILAGTGKVTPGPGKFDEIPDERDALAESRIYCLVGWEWARARQRNWFIANCWK